MSYLSHILPALLMLLASSCSANQKSKEISESYPLPSVPSGITDPHERASVICARFWNDAIFPSEPGDSISPALEQAMANFAAIATMAAETDSVRIGVNEMLRKGGTDYIMPLAERYLYNYDSPLRNEETFLLFLEAAPEWERTELLKPEVQKNRVGSTAADFEFVDSKGRRGSLSEFVKANGSTLVYFFDSECDVCKELIPNAGDIAEAEGLAVLAVCPESNAGSFDLVTPLFPDGWTIVRDLGAIDSDELYIFPVLPSAYIIDPTLTVIAKDRPL